MAAPRITCVFHTSESIPALVHSPAGRSLVGDLLVECAPAPSLVFALNLETPAHYPGIAGLLGGAQAATLAHTLDQLPAPIVLAPGTAIAPATIRTALALLPRSEPPPRSITLLVPVDQARALGATLALADRFAIAWDIANCPHEDLLDFARWLDAEQIIDRANFHGLVTYASQPVEAPHEKRIATLLGSLAPSGQSAGGAPVTS